MPASRSGERGCGERERGGRRPGERRHDRRPELAAGAGRAASRSPTATAPHASRGGRGGARARSHGQGARSIARRTACTNEEAAPHRRNAVRDDLASRFPPSLRSSLVGLAGPVGGRPGAGRVVHRHGRRRRARAAAAAGRRRRQRRRPPSRNAAPRRPSRSRTSARRPEPSLADRRPAGRAGARRARRRARTPPSGDPRPRRRRTAAAVTAGAGPGPGSDRGDRLAAASPASQLAAVAGAGLCLLLAGAALRRAGARPP